METLSQALKDAVSAETSSTAGRFNMFAMIGSIVFVVALTQVTIVLEFFLKLVRPNATLGPAPVVQLFLVFVGGMILCVGILALLQATRRGD